MIVGRWQLVETLGPPESWSMLTAGTAPREWASYLRAIPAPVQQLVAEVHANGTAGEAVLPVSRRAWSGLRVRAVPVCRPGAAPHGVQVWAGEGDPPPALAVAPFHVDARARTVRIRPAALGQGYRDGEIEWTVPEPFQRVVRFDGALDMVATVTRSAPNGRWLGVATVRSPSGPRSLLLATRNGAGAARHAWRGLAVDVTDSVAPQHKSVEAATLELLADSTPRRYLVVVDTAQVRLVRWVTEPLPGLRWRGADERGVPHPDDRARIHQVRAQILAGTNRVALPGLRLATEDGGWLTVDVAASPLPGALTGNDSATPEFALVQLQLPTA